MSHRAGSDPSPVRFMQCVHWRRKGGRTVIVVSRQSNAKADSKSGAYEHCGYAASDDCCAGLHGYIHVSMGVQRIEYITK